jgi:alkanesulfonate monooxygenase SsuD/methylene tetrahydromethanopterin reductase-like flavin-dependent oxidoreductase (luciferase family)
MSPLIGFTLQERHFATGVERLQSALGRIETCDIDFVSVLDHLAFWDGAGFDGMINAAAVAAAHPRLPITVSVLILPVRHPVLVARQISSLNLLAPGRLTLGVGVGGEDRNEILAAGVDPHTRGKRMDESLTALRALLVDGEITLHGEHFTLASVQIHPTSPQVPILVGGRSNAALRRTARLGDGWLAFACSAQRFAEATAMIQAEAELHGRGTTTFDHGLVVWCGYSQGALGEPGPLAREMEALYKTPFAKFAKYCFEGSPMDVAEQLAPYAKAGCQRFCIIPVGDDADHEIDCVAETARNLRHLMAIASK